MPSKPSQTLVFINWGLDNPLIPTSEQLTLSKDYRHSKDEILSIDNDDHVNSAATVAATSLKNAQVLLVQSELVTEEVRPILYYYGALSFFEFVTRVIVRRERKGNPGHGLGVSCASDGWDFNRNWARNCWVEFKSSGDFPFLVDALTLAGWPSLFSKFRLHRDSKVSPWEVRENPAPLVNLKKVSLDLLCNFDLETYKTDHPEINDWLLGTNNTKVWKMTGLLMDFLVVFISSNLARYYIPAWNAIIEAEKSSIYNDIRRAYDGIAGELPYFFQGEHPFKHRLVSNIV